MSLYRLIRPIIFTLKEEKAHKFAISTLKKDILPGSKAITNEIIENKVFDIYFPNPIGLAAGFDKNAEVIAPLLKQGFGFIEVGTVTPKAQGGNPKPRLFRLEQDMAIINRLGFNNKGATSFAANLKKWQKIKKESNLKGIVGVNIGKNKDSEGIDDYIKLLKKIYGSCDYITINISSPNTPKLRDLQNKKELNELLSALTKERNALAKQKSDSTPLLLKISPDLGRKKQEEIAEAAIKHKIDGLIISNTTTKRGMLKHEHHAAEIGGLSGRPLFSSSTNLLRDMYKLTDGKIPLIGVGGVFTGDDAYDKIRSGASLVQLYTALIFGGMGIVKKINKRLTYLLEQDGFSNISEAIGIDVKK